MENSIDYLLKEIYLDIPSEILKETFKSKEKTLDAILKEDVIVDIVLRRCNLYSGKLAKITLKQSYQINLDATKDTFPFRNTYVYKIPLEVREYRDISHTIALSYPMSMTIYETIDDVKSICSMKSQILGSNVGHEDIPVMPIPILLKNNMIKLEPSFDLHVEYILSCLLKYDSNFTNISPNSLRYLSNLCVLATKSLIYNRLIIPLGNAYLVGGQELGKFKDIVESYQDSNKEFEEALLKFRGAEVFDKDIMLSMIGLML
jgi:hypothetical protein